MAAVKESYSVHVCVCAWVCVCIHVFEPAHSYIALYSREIFTLKVIRAKNFFGVKFSFDLPIF